MGVRLYHLLGDLAARLERFFFVGFMGLWPAIRAPSSAALMRSFVSSGLY
jgi:hypothetical protein